MDQEKIELIRNKFGLPFHYYGDTVRRLFILSAIIMIVTLPFLANRLPVPPFTSILLIVALALMAGFLAPRNKWAITFDLLVSVGGVLVFEYYAVDAYNAYSVSDILFLVDQTLAILFLFASYYASKTMRSLFNKVTHFDDK